MLDKCPHCNSTHVQTELRLREPLKSNDNSIVWNVERCNNPECKRIVLLEKSGNETINIYPVGSYELDSSININTEIRNDFKEAGYCLGAGCYKASMVMSRRALQRCLKEQGCTQHNLVNAIDEAIKQNILRKTFHDVAHEIRQYGNLGAHPDDDQLLNASRENAEQILEFVRIIIHDFYEIPAAVAKLRHKRQSSNT